MLSISPFWILLSWAAWSSGAIVVAAGSQSRVNLRSNNVRISIVLAVLVYGWMITTIPVYFSWMM